MPKSTVGRILLAIGVAVPLVFVLAVAKILLHAEKMAEYRTCVNNNNIWSSKKLELQSKYVINGKHWSTYWDGTDEAKQWLEYEEIAAERCRHLNIEFEWLSLTEFQMWAQDFDFVEWATCQFSICKSKR